MSGSSSASDRSSRTRRTLSIVSTLLAAGYPSRRPESGAASISRMRRAAIRRRRRRAKRSSSMRIGFTYRLHGRNLRAVAEPPGTLPRIRSEGWGPRWCCRHHADMSAHAGMSADGSRLAAPDAELAHPGLQGRALETEARGGPVRTAEHPVGLAQRAHDGLALRRLQRAVAGGQDDARGELRRGHAEREPARQADGA